MAGQAKRRALHLARQEASRSTLGVRLDIDPADALQEVLDRSVAILRHAGEMADDLAEDKMYVTTAFGPVPNEWIRLEADMRAEVASLADRMIKSGLAERLVRVQEAQTDVMLRYIVASAQQAGISRDDLRRLGPALRDNLHMLQGGAADADSTAEAA